MRKIIFAFFALMFTIAVVTFGLAIATSYLAAKLYAAFLKPEASKVYLTNPLGDVTMDEPRADVPAPTEEGPRVTTVIEGTEEFDGKHTLGRELTEREKDLARILLRVAKMAGSRHYALTEPKPDGLMVATVIGVGVEFDGYWVRDKKLAGWEKELVRHLLKLAREGGGEYEPNEKE